MRRFLSASCRASIACSRAAAASVSSAKKGVGHNDEGEHGGGKVQNLLVMTLLSIALAISIHAVNAKEIILKCRTLNSNGSQQLTIDLDNGWLAFASGEQAAHGEANSSFKILKVSDVAITAILENPIPTHGEEIFVLNRETGQYITTHVGLSCADNKCSSQKGPTIETFRGNCRPPIF